MFQPQNDIGRFDRAARQPSILPASAIALPDQTQVEQAGGPSRSELPHTYYCLWRHVASQVPVLGEKVLSACRGRAIDKIEIYQEAVGGPPHHRFALQRAIGDTVNRGGEWMWKLQLGAAQALAGAASWLSPSSSFALGAREEECRQLQIDLMRNLRKATGAEVQFRFIDMHEGHPDYCSVVESDRAENELANFLSAPACESIRAARGTGQLSARLEKLATAKIVCAGESLRVRDESLRAELGRLPVSPSEGTLRLVITGAGHIGISRDLQEGRRGRILASFSPELERMLPERLRGVYHYDYSLMKCLKAANGMAISAEDARDSLLHTLLREAILSEIWGGKAPRSPDRKERGAERAVCLATDALIAAGAAGRASMYERCLSAVSGAAESPEPLYEVMLKPLGETLAGLRRGDSGLKLGPIGKRVLELLE